MAGRVELRISWIATVIALLALATLTTSCGEAVVGGSSTPTTTKTTNAIEDRAAATEFLAAVRKYDEEIPGLRENATRKAASQIASCKPAQLGVSSSQE